MRSISEISTCILHNRIRTKIEILSWIMELAEKMKKDDINPIHIKSICNIAAEIAHEINKYRSVAQEIEKDPSFLRVIDKLLEIKQQNEKEKN